MYVYWKVWIGCGLRKCPKLSTPFEKKQEKKKKKKATGNASLIMVYIVTFITHVLLFFLCVFIIKVIHPFWGDNLMYNPFSVSLPFGQQHSNFGGWLMYSILYFWVSKQWYSYQGWGFWTCSWVLSTCSCTWGLHVWPL